MALFAVLSVGIVGRDLHASSRVRPARSLLGESAALTARYCDILPPVVSQAFFAYARLKEQHPQAQAFLRGTGLTPEEKLQLPGSYRLMAEFEDEPTPGRLAHLRGLGYSSLQRLTFCLLPILALVGASLCALLPVVEWSPAPLPRATRETVGKGLLALGLWITGSALVVSPLLARLGLEERENRILLSITGTYALLALALWGLARVGPRAGQAVVNLQGGAFTVNTRVAAVGYLATLVAVNLCEAAVTTLSGLDLDGRLLAQSPVVSSDPRFLLVLSVLGVVLGPYLEEKLYRDRLLESLRAVTGPVSASILVSALFALSHAAFWASPGLFVLSLILCGVYLKSGSVLTAWVVHAAWNLTSLSLAVGAI